MSSSKLLCFSLCFLVFPVIGLKLWIPRTNMNEKRNWNIQDIPRNCDRLSFGITSDISVLWSNSDMVISGLTLPQSGTVVFLDELTISFTDKKNCPGGRDMVYKRNDWKDWLDPNNWEYHSDEVWLPHNERVPCFGEDVKFPPGSSFAVKLPLIMVPVGKIYFNNEEYDGDDWADYLNSGQGRIQFLSTKGEQKSWLYDLSCLGQRKCACGKSSYVFEDRIYKFVDTSLLNDVICMSAKKSCGSVKCYSPVTPYGHCCGVCGAVMTVRDNAEDDTILNQIKQKVKEYWRAYSDEVKFHVGRIADKDIQVTLLSESSGGISSAFALASVIKDHLTDQKYDVTSLKFSGLTLSSYLLNGTSGIVFGTLFTALLFFASIYYMYIILPEKKFSTVSGDHPFQFARFRNVISEASSEEKLEIGTESTETSEGFHNPTFSGDATQEVPKVECEQVEKKTEEESVQEYNNPTYHELEKTKDFSFFEVKTGEGSSEHEQQFSEVEL